MNDAGSGCWGCGAATRLHCTILSMGYSMSKRERRRLGRLRKQGGGKEGGHVHRQSQARGGEGMTAINITPSNNDKDQDARHR